MAEVLDQVARPDWQKITEALHQQHLLDATGKVPTPERVRQTWIRVRRDVAASRGKRPKSQLSASASIVVHEPKQPAVEAAPSGRHKWTATKLK